LPEGEELDALYDRFPLRFWVKYLDDPNSLSTLLFGQLSPPSIQIDLNELEQAQDQTKMVIFPSETQEKILEIKARLEDEGHKASDRRWKSILKVLQAHAWLDGDTVVLSEHFELLPDMLWSEPKDRASIAQIVGVVGDPISVKAQEILDSAKECFRDVGHLPASPTAEQKSDWVKKASLVDTQLQQMIHELGGLGNGSRPKKVEHALDGVRKLRERLLKAMQASFHI
jgi:MoxR-like ATPase